MRQIPKESLTTTNKSTNVIAPVGGLNLKDSLASMKSNEAFILDNMFPLKNSVVLRKGTTQLAELDSGTYDTLIQSLLPYSSADGTVKLFAGSAAGIFNVTAGGTITTVASACTAGQWISTMITTSGGNFLWACNGTDDSRYYNGTAWTVLNGTSTPALAGITSASITNVALFKSRLFFCEKDSLSFWYLPVNSVAGTAVEFPLGSLFRKGGYIVAIGSLTMDAGDGPDDRFVAVTSEGEVALYIGTDPSDAATWGLSGVFQLSPPVSKKCLERFEGDLIYFSSNGVFPLSKALVTSNTRKTTALSDKIDPAIAFYLDKFSTVFGWEVLLFPTVGMLILNVPLGSNYSYQFVMNTETNAWCRFTDLNAACFCVYDKKLFFATGMKVHQGWVGTSDNNNSIIVKIQQAYNFFRSTSIGKHIKFIKFFINATTPINIQFAIDTDFSTNGGVFNKARPAADANTATWDYAIFDQSRWVGLVAIANWQSADNIPGQAASIRLAFNALDTEVEWITTGYILEPCNVF